MRLSLRLRLLRCLRLRCLCLRLRCLCLRLLRLRRCLSLKN
jgi:hypothetical protein